MIPFSVVVEDPTPCEQCGGDGIVPTAGGWDVCPGCNCSVCGQPTDTPPECGNCFLNADAAAVRRADR